MKAIQISRVDKSNSTKLYSARVNVSGAQSRTLLGELLEISKSLANSALCFVKFYFTFYHATFVW